MFLFVYREINSFSLCFKTGNLSTSVSGKPTSKDSNADTDNKIDPPTLPERQTSVHTVLVQPLDDVTFKLNEKNDAKSLLEKVVVAGLRTIIFNSSQLVTHVLFPYYSMPDQRSIF